MFVAPFFVDTTTWKLVWKISPSSLLLLLNLKVSTSIVFELKLQQHRPEARQINRRRTDKYIHVDTIRQVYQHVRTRGHDATDRQTNILKLLLNEAIFKNKNSYPSQQRRIDKQCKAFKIGTTLYSRNLPKITVQ